MGDSYTVDPGQTSFEPNGPAPDGCLASSTPTHLHSESGVASATEVAWARVWRRVGVAVGDGRRVGEGAAGGVIPERGKSRRLLNAGAVPSDALFV